MINRGAKLRDDIFQKNEKLGIAQSESPLGEEQADGHSKGKQNGEMVLEGVQVSSLAG